MKNIWFGKVWHLFALLLLALAIVGLYSVAHWLLRDNYKRSVTNLVTSTLHLYRYQVSEDGASVVLTQGGVPFRTDLTELAKAPFGLEKLESYRGALGHHAGIAAQVTAYFKRRKETLLAQRVQVGSSWARFPATAFSHANTSLFVEVSAGAVESLKAAHLEDFLGVAPEVLLSGTGYSKTAPSLAEVPATEEPVVRVASKEAGDKLSGLRGGPVPVPPELRAGIREHFDRWMPELVAQLQVACTNATPLGTNYSTLPKLLAALSCQMQEELGKVAEGETGSFWLMGRYRWWEMIFWVWFGVVTMSISKLTPHLLGQKTDERWEPRETLTVFAKLFYAPVLALVLFFMLGFLGFGQNELAEFGRSSLVSLGIAFILGLFPNTSFRILKDLCTQLFRQDIRDGGKKRTEIKVNKVISERSKLGGEVVYTVDDLKKNVGNHISAIAK